MTATFAVIQTGGKQYKVSEGDVVTIEKLKGEHTVGDTVTFDEVLMVDDGKTAQVGTPVLAGKKVEAEFQEEGRAKKVNIIRFRSKGGPNASTKNGHRQPYNKVKIIKIA